jgi:catechol 2,3-dioxygenase-like lactoylglutathione lyase family enzyme
MAQTIVIERVDHIGIRVRDLERALAFYGVLGFNLAHRAVGDDVAIVRNEHGVELNLIFNANAGDPDSNILMDAPDKFAGYTHIALRVSSIFNHGDECTASIASSLLQRRCPPAGRRSPQGRSGRTELAEEEAERLGSELQRRSGGWGYILGHCLSLSGRSRESGEMVSRAALSRTGIFSFTR